MAFEKVLIEQFWFKTDKKENWKKVETEKNIV